MSLRARIATNRAAFARTEDERTFSAASQSRFEVASAMIRDHARGAVLDIGCGLMPFRKEVLAVADSYTGFDVEARTAGVDILGDVQHVTSIADHQFDSVLCFEVLEHVPDPAAALAEIARILRPSGTLLATAPHLSRIHEEPHDYFRFTRHGLRVLVSKAGLEITELTAHAGLFSFLGHQISTMLLGLTNPLPVAGPIARTLNRRLLVGPPRALDRLLDPDGLFALGYAFVAVKPEART